MYRLFASGRLTSRLEASQQQQRTLSDMTSSQYVSVRVSIAATPFARSSSPRLSSGGAMMAEAAKISEPYGQNCRDSLTRVDGANFLGRGESHEVDSFIEYATIYYMLYIIGSAACE